MSSDTIAIIILISVFLVLLLWESPPQPHIHI